VKKGKSHTEGTTSSFSAISHASSNNPAQETLRCQHYAQLPCWSLSALKECPSTLSQDGALSSYGPPPGGPSASSSSSSASAGDSIAPARPQVRPIGGFRVRNSSEPKSPAEVGATVTQPQTGRSLARALSISAFPLTGDQRDGDPISDAYACDVYSNRSILAVSDGHGFGKSSREAAIRACNAFVDYLHSMQTKMNTVQEVGHFMHRALSRAHRAILTTTMTHTDNGACTLAGGMVVRLSSSRHAPKWAFVGISIGHCKMLHMKHRHSEWVDLTRNQRARSPKDRGSRIGQVISGNQPDLENVSLYCTPVDKDDLIVLLTDGVFSNIDPALSGEFTPEQCGLDPELHPSWLLDFDRKTLEAADPTLVQRWIEQDRVRDEFLCKRLHDWVHDLAKEGFKADQVCDRLLNRTLNLTAPLRNHLEQRKASDEGLPSNAIGVLDHCTALVHKVTYTMPARDSPHESVPVHVQLARSTGLTVDDESRTTSNVNYWQWQVFMPLRDDQFDVWQPLSLKASMVASHIDKMPNARLLEYHLNTNMHTFSLRVVPRYATTTTGPQRKAATVAAQQGQTAERTTQQASEHLQGFVLAVRTRCEQNPASLQESWTDTVGELMLSGEHNKRDVCLGMIKALARSPTAGLSVRRAKRMVASLDHFDTQRDTYQVVGQQRQLNFSDLGTVFKVLSGDMTITQTDFTLYGPKHQRCGRYRSLQFRCTKPEYMRTLCSADVLPHIEQDRSRVCHWPEFIAFIGGHKIRDNLDDSTVNTDAFWKHV